MKKSKKNKKPSAFSLDVRDKQEKMQDEILKATQHLFRKDPETFGLALTYLGYCAHSTRINDNNWKGKLGLIRSTEH